MKITLMVVGKTVDKSLIQMIEDYVKRLKFYTDFEMVIIPDLKNNKNMPFDVQKEKEGEMILRSLNDSDDVILMDEHGKEFSSVEFASYIQKKMTSGLKRLVFIIGGPYGFSPAVYARAGGKISLSRMTFSHQMVRLIFTEQLYRAFTILKGEPYHHE
ncbi:MAG: 23S rRNA (pseudouridine(1915)-N(3))-methyltransferase RlmH [Paludibacteraceae bacterium]|nr:23S rRNA (pseudouridine(1915)-N(3))-methyltransferase RlmH [Paludibacteraceae bacterium]MBR3872117.1 23S rRNA (pseudouridine(1915)-N(3))-methyltransferase RlmH [Paludibacteraceae bacterium]MBR6686270.1 23S rRNA (pseudouridine(1915)-N(3))-methyltransferase RlmH [Paludibacteraceae bacterium]